MNRVFLMRVMLFAVLATVAFSSCKKHKDEPEKNEMEKLLEKGNIRGTLEKNITLEAGKEYELTGPVIVPEGFELTIPAGVTIKAHNGYDNYILVLQGGKIHVNGTAEKPVVMTANIESATSGYWGGLIINGKAPLDGGTTGSTEINKNYSYGGSDAADNSGTIRYLAIKYAGARSSANVEHNGLTLNGVGNGTVIENIFVLESADDGVEFFGGSVNVTNLLVVNPDDDMFDFTQGYTGTLKNAYGIWEANYSSTEADPRGIEADGNLDGESPNNKDQSDFKVANMTIDLKLAPDASNKQKLMKDVMCIRRGAKATIENALVKGTGSYGTLVNFTDRKTNGNPASAVNVTSKLTEAAKVEKIKGKGNVLESTDNSGCDKSLFGWTKYNNF